MSKSDLVKNKYTYIALAVILAIFVPYVRLGLFAVLLLVLVVVFVHNICDNYFIAIALAFVVLNYISSIFTIIIYYVSPNESILFLDAMLTIFSFASITGVLDLIIETWISSQAIGFHIVVVSSITVIIIIAAIIYIRRK